MATPMQSKYRGMCQCGASFPRGASIEYDRQSRRVTACPKCNISGQKPAPDMARIFDMAFEDQCRDACGPGL